MRRSSAFFALACALAFAGAWAYTPVRHDGSYTTNGVTYAQRGGLGSADYVVTNIDADAVGRVKSVNGKDGVVTLDYSDVSALPDSQALLEGNANFSNAVVSVSPPVELPDKWALSNVTNASGNAVGAADVGALPDNEQGLKENANLAAAVSVLSPRLAASNIVSKAFSATSEYRTGEVVLYEGKLYRALRSQTGSYDAYPPTPSWIGEFWEEISSSEIDTAMKGALYDAYLPLGVGGYSAGNDGFKVRIAYAYGGVSYLHGNDDGYIGVRKGDDGAYLTPEGHIYIVRDATHYNTYDLNTMIYGGNIQPITYENIHSSAPLVVSPKYVYQYLTNLYYTASEVNTAIGNAGHVPNTRSINGKPLSADIVLAPADIGTLSEADIAAAIAAAKPLRVYGDEGYTNYIDGLRGVYALSPPILAYTNETGDVFAPLEGAESETYFCEIDGVTNYIVYANFRFFLRRDGTTGNVAVGVRNWENIIYMDGGYVFYPSTLPQTWNRVGTLALESWVGDAITAATNGFVKAEDIDLSEYATTGSVASVAATVPNNITRSTVDATLVHCDSGNCTNAILYIRQATHSLAGLMTAADKTALDGLVASAVTRETVTNVVNEVKELHYDEVLNVTWETRIVGGEMKFFAVTNANTAVLGN